MQAALRTMGAQSVKPRSLELQQEVQRELAALRRGLAAELRRALGVAREGQQEREQQQQQDQEPSSHISGGGVGGSGATAGASSAAAGSGGWFGGWFGGAGLGQKGAATSSTSRLPSVAAIRAGQHPALRHAAEEAGRLIQQYNSAVLADKETFGGSWPLHQMRQLDWRAEVDDALAALGDDGKERGRCSSRSGGSSGGGSTRKAG